MLKEWRAGAIVVSHDRALLDAMDAIVELSPAGASRYQGNFAAYQHAKAVRIAAAEHDLAVAEKRTADLARRTQETLERQQQRDAAGQRRGARGDLPRILVGARSDNAEKSAGGSARAAERQRTEARQQLEEARSRIQAVKAVSIAVPSSGLHAAKTVLSVERVTFGHRPGQPVLEDVSLTISGPERVAISGRNGAGKSTLLDLVAGRLLTLLQARGVPLASAVSYGALIGPAQVGVRLVEMAFRGRHHPLWTLTAALGLVALGLVLLAAGVPGVGAWLVLYGSGNGIYSIARGTVPLAVFGPVRYPLVVGRLARPGLVAQALAPPAGAFVLVHAGPDLLWWLLLALALVNLGLVVSLWRTR